MSKKAVVDAADRLEVNDTIVIDRVDTPLVVTDIPVKDNKGAIIFSAEQQDHPEEGLVTSITFGIGHPSGGADAELTVQSYSEAPPERVAEIEKDYDDIRTQEQFEVSSLSIVD
ncbi:hypothetical protein [Halorubrum cibi]|uniref:hypothetical protein n=1 Tax=Halorubrum cibi TaxID=413815 RepID=UPI00115E04A5|nr:hypothetical protein [Halorubrum cibi]